MTNEIDRLMDEDPLNLSAQDIDKIIEYYRSTLADWEAGPKAKAKPTKGQRIDLVELGLKKPPTPLRRI
jgi:hypothetical protein